MDLNTRLQKVKIQVSVANCCTTICLVESHPQDVHAIRGMHSVLPYTFHSWQISTKRGPDSRFVIETNTKSWWPKSSRSRIVKLMDRDWVTQPRVEYVTSNKMVPHLPKTKKNIKKFDSVNARAVCVGPFLPILPQNQPFLLLVTKHQPRLTICRGVWSSPHKFHLYLI